MGMKGLSCPQCKELQWDGLLSLNEDKPLWIIAMLQLIHLGKNTHPLHMGTLHSHSTMLNVTGSSFRFLAWSVCPSIHPSIFISFCLAPPPSPCLSIPVAFTLTTRGINVLHSFFTHLQWLSTTNCDLKSDLRVESTNFWLQSFLKRSPSQKSNFWTFFALGLTFQATLSLSSHTWLRLLGL